MENTCEAGD